MLVLTRRAQEIIRIGDSITLTVVRIDSDRVRIGIEAPRDVKIMRGEIADVTTPAPEEQHVAAAQDADPPIRSGAGLES